MDEGDERMLSFALEETFERILFLEGGNMVPEPVIPSIADSVDATVNIIFPPPDWQLEVFPNPMIPGRYLIRAFPPRNIRFVRCEWWWGGWEPAKWAFSLPTLEAGDFTLYHEEDAEGRAFGRQIMQIFNRLVTNRMKAWHPASGTVFCANGRMDYWAGHHALEWCREDPTRMLTGCYQPTDDWAPPDTPWHRRLRARLAAVDSAKRTRRAGARAAGPGQRRRPPEKQA